MPENDVGMPAPGSTQAPLGRPVGLVRELGRSGRRTIAAVATVVAAAAMVWPLVPSAPVIGARLAATLTDPTPASVNSVAFSPDGKTLAIAYLISYSSIVNDLNNLSNLSDISQLFNRGSSTDLWDVAARRITATLTDPESMGVASVAFSPDGKTLAAGDSDGSTYLWDLATRRITATLTDPESSAEVTSVAFSPDGSTLAVGGRDGSAYLWNIATGKLAVTVTGSRQGDHLEVNSVAFSPDGQTLAVGGANGSTYLWDVAARRITATLTDRSISGYRAVASVAFSPDSKILAVGYLDGSTCLWDIYSG
jgi:WD40 repeat protein